MAWTKGGKAVEGTCADRDDMERQLAAAEDAAAAEAISRCAWLRSGFVQEEMKAVQAAGRCAGRSSRSLDDKKQSLGEKIFAAEMGDYVLTASDLVEAAADDWAKVVLGLQTPAKLADAIKAAHEAEE